MKGSFFSGQQYGKLGETISYRSRGKQVTRIYNSRPANPQSFGQAQQRMIFATVGVAMRSMRGIVDHSFQGIKYGADSLTKFMSENLKALRANLGVSDKVIFNIKGVSKIQPAPYVVSDGSLNTIGGKLSAAGEGVVIPTSWTGSIADQATYESALASIGFVPGDQLTLVGITDDDSSDDNIVYENGGNAYRNCGTSRFVVGSIIFPKQFTGTAIGLDELVEYCQNYGQMEGAAMGMEALSDRLGNAGIAFEFSSDSLPALAAGAIIRSAQQDGEWKRSPEVMDCLLDLELNSDDCVASYQAAERELTSDRFLNQATTEAQPERSTFVNPIVSVSAGGSTIQPINGIYNIPYNASQITLVTSRIISPVVYSAAGSISGSGPVWIQNSASLATLETQDATWGGGTITLYEGNNLVATFVVTRSE